MSRVILKAEEHTSSQFMSKVMILISRFEKLHHLKISSYLIYQSLTFLKMANPLAMSELAVALPPLPMLQVTTRQSDSCCCPPIGPQKLAKNESLDRDLKSPF